MMGRLPRYGAWWGNVGQGGRCLASSAANRIRLSLTEPLGCT